MAAVILLDLRARRFDQLAVLDARGARGLAGAAIQALIDVLDEGFAERETALDPPAPSGGFARAENRLRGPRVYTSGSDSSTGRNERSAHSRRKTACRRPKIRSAAQGPKRLLLVCWLSHGIRSHLRNGPGSKHFAGRKHFLRAASMQNPAASGPTRRRSRVSLRLDTTPASRWR